MEINCAARELAPSETLLGGKNDYSTRLERQETEVRRQETEVRRRKIRIQESEEI